jgi:hypothetical protein
MLESGCRSGECLDEGESVIFGNELAFCTILVWKWSGVERKEKIEGTPNPYEMKIVRG